MDYIFRWLDLKFLQGQQQLLFQELRKAPEAEPSAAANALPATTSVPENRPPATGVVHSTDALKEIVDLGDAPSCHYCGAIMTRNGSCYRCGSCGATSGCS